MKIQFPPEGGRPGGKSGFSGIVGNIMENLNGIDKFLEKMGCNIVTILYHAVLY
jgi:hypothetical protein